MFEWTWKESIPKKCSGDDLCECGLPMDYAHPFQYINGNEKSVCSKCLKNHLISIGHAPDLVDEKICLIENHADRKQIYFTFITCVDFAALNDKFIDKIKYAMKNYYRDHGFLSVKFLLHLARVLENTPLYTLLSSIEIDLTVDSQKSDLLNLSHEQFDLIKIALTDDQHYYYYTALQNQKK